jgi:hypothetical protein
LRGRIERQRSGSGRGKAMLRMARDRLLRMPGNPGGREKASMIGDGAPRRSDLREASCAVGFDRMDGLSTSAIAKLGSPRADRFNQLAQPE